MKLLLLLQFALLKLFFSANLKKNAQSFRGEGGPATGGAGVNLISHCTENCVNNVSGVGGDARGGTGVEVGAISEPYEEYPEEPIIPEPVKEPEMPKGYAKKGYN